MRKGQIATAVAVGYALGRTRRMKLAIMAGGVLLGRRVKSPSDLLAKAGGAVPTELSGTLRDRLVEAARSAAVASASDKIESLGDTLSERAAKIRSPQDESEDQESSQDESEDQESPQAEPADQEASQDESQDQESSENESADQESAPSEAENQPAHDAKESRSGSGESARARTPRKPSAPRKPKPVSTRKAGGSDG